VEAFARQLEKCGGVRVQTFPPPVAPPAPPATPAPPAQAPPAAATPQDLEALERRIIERMDQMFRRGLGK
jgi:hypothetical protein